MLKDPVDFFADIPEPSRQYTVYDIDGNTSDTYTAEEVADIICYLLGGTYIANTLVIEKPEQKGFCRMKKDGTEVFLKVELIPVNAEEAKKFYQKFIYYQMNFWI